MTAPERIWAKLDCATVYMDGSSPLTARDREFRNATEYVRADLITARCSSCDGTGDVHRADGEWLGEFDCGSEFRHAYDVEANPSKAFRVIQSQAARISSLEATPPAPKVTDEMVEAALKSLHCNPVSWDHPSAVRAALTAAQEDAR